MSAVRLSFRILSSLIVTIMNLVRRQSKATNMSFKFYTLITFNAILYQLNYEASLEAGQVLISIIIIIVICKAMKI